MSIRIKRHIHIILLLLTICILTGMFSIQANAKCKAEAADLQKAYGLLQKYAPATVDADSSYLNSIASLKPVATDAVKNCKTDYEKIKAIYNLVKNNMTYDSSKTGVNNSSVQIWNEKRGVCAHYAAMCKDFLQLIGIPCQYVRGDNHAFNVAWDSGQGKWIVFDATWGRFDLNTTQLANMDSHELYGFKIKYGKNKYTIDFDSYLSKYRVQLYSVDPSTVNLEIPSNIEGIPLTLTYIYAIKDLTKIESVSIPDSFTRIGYFTNNRIKEIFIPKSVTEILQLGCYGLKSVYYEGTKAEWDKISGHSQISSSIVQYNHGAKHSLKHLEYLPATHNASGHIDCYYCSKCGKYFKSSAATFSSIIDATSIEIYQAETVKLAKTSYTYTGRAIRPAVTIKDSKGNSIDKAYYTITYGKNTSVGKGSATVSFKGRYSGNVILTFKINPKPTTISSVTAGKKSFTVRWNKRKEAGGYELRYSTSSKFTSKTTKTVKISSSASSSKKISKLIGGKKYYVKIRAYKVVNNTKYYSEWSSYKTVKTAK